MSTPDTSERSEHDSRSPQEQAMSKLFAETLNTFLDAASAPYGSPNRLSDAQVLQIAQTLGLPVPEELMHCFGTSIEKIEIRCCAIQLGQEYAGPTADIGFIDPDTGKEDETQFDVGTEAEALELFRNDFCKDNHWSKTPQILYVSIIR